MPNASERWTRQQVRSAQVKIKNSLDKTFGFAPSKDRAVFALRNASRLMDEPESQARLEGFVYLISALVQHQRVACFSANQIKQATSRALMLLQLQGVKPGQSKLAFLFGDLNQAISLILRRDGEQWASTWQHRLGLYLSRPLPSESIGFNALASANRYSRLGHSDLAEQCYREALASPLDDSQRELATLGLIRCLRLGKQQKLASELASGLNTAQWSVASQHELLWERSLLEQNPSDDLGRLITLTKAGAPCHLAGYCLEAFLWAFSSQQLKWQSRIGKISTLKRKRTLNLKNEGFFALACETIEQCYDSDIPLSMRLDELGKRLNERDKLVNCDHELLFLCASVRWLRRVHVFDLAEICWREYRDFSLRLSAGVSNDVLAVKLEVA